jgi:hypothetical protein
MEREARELRCSKVTVVKCKDTYIVVRAHIYSSIYLHVSVADGKYSTCFGIA